MSSRTRKALKDYRDKTKHSEEASNDQVYIIESIMEVTETNGEEVFKVKWFGFPEEAATLEPAKSIPKFIQNYYKDRSKLGKKLPNPRIKHTKKLTDGTNYHFLTWEGEGGG